MVKVEREPQLLAGPLDGRVAGYVEVEDVDGPVPEARRELKTDRDRKKIDGE